MDTIDIGDTAHRIVEWPISEKKPAILTGSVTLAVVLSLVSLVFF